MKTINTFLIIGLIMWNTGAHSNEKNLKLTLQQEVDQNCDGIGESQTQAASGECIIYHIEAFNQSALPLNTVQINAKIPQHTKLHPQMRLENNMLDEASVSYHQQGSNGGTISMKITTLPSGKKYLRYAVQVK